MHVSATTRPIRVLVVDDSLVIRGLIARHLKDAPGITVVGSASDGAKAVDIVGRGGVDVVILDIEMPVMDGIAALPKLLAIDPKLVVIMASTLTTRNADISLKALKLGAADYVPKPTTTSEIYGAADFRRELIEKITLLGRRRIGTAKTADLAKRDVARAISLRPPASARPQVLAVASSTGGPRALDEFFGNLGHDIGIPVVVTQHMPPTFTTLLADHLTRETGWLVKEAQDGDVLLGGQVLVAAGDRHLVLNGKQVRLDDGARENFCRPAADPMLRSLIAAYGSRVLSVVLTGMGQDGLLGCQAVIAAGGTVLAQDEASSVVWGMPGAVASHGLCSLLAPPAQLARAVTQLIKTGRL
jgi:two-component system chemotaxis response regulator CheB